MQKYSSDVSVSKTVLVRIWKWSKDGTQITSLVSRRRNGVRGNCLNIVIANANIHCASIEVKMGIFTEKYNEVILFYQGIWGLVRNSGNPPKIHFSYSVCVYIHMLSFVRLSKA